MKPMHPWDSLTADFLYWNPRGDVDMPHSNTFIGVEFEIGGTHEDWGFGVYEFNYNSEKDAYDKKTISSGRNLEQAIQRAKDYYKESK